MFIVIDGIDGSGKGTQLILLKNSLESVGKKVFVLDYPRYGNKSAHFVEKYLNGEYGKNVSAEVSSIFYALDRYDDSFNFKEKLEEYDYIISNRYVSASMIHQGGKIFNKIERKKYLDWLEDLEYNIFKIPKPDRVIFLNVTPETSNKLVEKKGDREYITGNKNKDLHEEDASHILNAYEVANEIVDSNQGWVKIDCEENGKMLSREIITKKILNNIL